MKGNYWLTYSVPTKGSGLLKSATGKPEGPYINALKYDQPLIGNIDPSLFEDDDGKVYFVYLAGSIARMNDDMTGLVETPRPVTIINPDKDPRHHASKCYSRGAGDIGNEGVFLFKANGKYYMSCADSYHGRYSSMVAVADNVYGPYTLRHEAVPCGGHNTYFKDNNGQWWSTFFGNDNFAPFREKPAIVPINFGADGKIHVIINNTGSSSFWNKKTIIATTGMLALLLAIVIYVLYKIKHVKKKTV